MSLFAKGHALAVTMFSKKIIVGTNFASLVTVVTIDYEFWRRLNSEIASGKVAVYAQGDCCQSSVSGKWKHICEKKHVVWQLLLILFCFWKLYNQIQNSFKNQNLVFLRVSKMKIKFFTL